MFDTCKVLLALWRATVNAEKFKTGWGGSLPGGGNGRFQTSQNWIFFPTCQKVRLYSQTSSPDCNF